MPIRLSFKNTDEWLAQRNKGIGASEVSALFQANPYMTMYKLYHLKKGNIPPDEENTRMKVGKAFEEAILKAWSSLYNGTYIHNVDNDLMVNRENPYLMCTPDATIITSAGEKMYAEVKMTSAYTKWRIENNHIVEIPIEILIQLQHQMLVMGEEKIMLIVMFFSEIYQQVMFRNDMFIKKLKTRVKQFKTCLDSNTEPLICSDDANTLALLYPKIKENYTVLLPIEAQEWDNRISVLSREIKEIKKQKLMPLEKERELCKNKIKHILKDASVGILPNGNKYIVVSSKRGGKYTKVKKVRTLKRIKGDLVNE